MGKVCVCNIVNFVDEHLAEDLSDPQRCLLLVSSWPSETPVSKAHDSDAEWYSSLKVGAARGMFVPVDDSEISCNELRHKILNGAM